MTKTITIEGKEFRLVELADAHNQSQLVYTLQPVTEEKEERKLQINAYYQDKGYPDLSTDLLFNRFDELRVTPSTAAAIAEAIEAILEEITEPKQKLGLWRPNVEKIEKARQSYLKDKEE